jgi:RNA polymerase sigma-70 factor (ECF subfamily)
MIDDERDILRQFQDGDPDGFAALYRAYGKPIYRYCLRCCGNVADAEDLTQETFLAAYQSLERFEGRSSLATWLYRIAFFQWKGMREKKRPERLSPNDCDALPDPALGGMDLWLERDNLRRALSTLPEPLRAAFLLVKAEGLRYREAAEVLGLPQGTVQSRVHDAVKQLRLRLADISEERGLRPEEPVARKGQRK